jgi:hypothetical protein
MMDAVSRRKLHAILVVGHTRLLREKELLVPSLRLGDIEKSRLSGGEDKSADKQCYKSSETL